MCRPKFTLLDKYLKNGKDFELTDKQYSDKTGADFPKNKYYAEKKSAVARYVKEYGYEVKVIPQRIIFKYKGEE